MAEQAEDGQRNRRRLAVGIVVGDKVSKLRRVELGRLTKHRKYGKYLRDRTICYVHDEDDRSGVGDEVEIMETRPLSKTKRWRLVRVVRRVRGGSPTVAKETPE